MKYTILILAILLLGGGFLVYSTIKEISEPAAAPQEEAEVNENATYETFTDTTAGLMFEYKSEPDGYVVDDLSEFIGPGDTEVLKVFRVMNKREKEELETSEGGREGPPTMNIMVLRNDDKLTASQWVDATPQFSNIDFAIGEVDRDAVVGGVNAVRYRSDGLYQSENVVVAHGAYIYHFTGSFMEENSAIHRDFKRLVDSVTFIPTDTTPIGGPPPKIDPEVACENALAYMTFESGAAADDFVAACVDGEHPEVIDRYIEELGLDGAAI